MIQKSLSLIEFLIKRRPKMKRLTIDYQSEAVWLALRAQDITSTEVSALFGCNKWLTEFELYHKKKSKNPEGIEDNEAMEVGRDFEATIAQYIAKKEGYEIKPKKHYMRLEGLGIGSSFDYEITKPFEAIFEIKNVGENSFKNFWKEEGEDIQAPLNLEFQFQHELLVSGASKLIVGAMIGGNRRKVFTRLPDEKVHKAILDKCAAFRKSLRDNVEPKPNFERDAAFIEKLFNKSDKAKEVAGDAEIDKLDEDYQSNMRLESVAKAHKAQIKAKILFKVDVGVAL
jgi:predicted phage-related endonuclease